MTGRFLDGFNRLNSTNRKRIVLEIERTAAAQEMMEQIDRVALEHGKTRNEMIRLLLAIGLQERRNTQQQ